MIYSAIKENLMRVEIMHSVAKEFYENTQNTNFRERIVSGGPTFPFNAMQYSIMEKESCLVGMVIAWSVITLESLVNHCLAESINNRALAKIAIEYPKEITEKLKIAKKKTSELSKKIAILSGGAEVRLQYYNLAEELSETRNLIVHDKPFEYVELENENVEINHIRTRGVALEKQLRYENIGEFFGKCDSLKDYIFSLANIESLNSEEISFTALIGR